MSQNDPLETVLRVEDNQPARAMHGAAIHRPRVTKIAPGSCPGGLLRHPSNGPLRHIAPVN